MPVRPSVAVAWCVLLLAGCASAPPSDLPTVAIERTVALPPSVLAAITGGALRSGLPFADPVPGARGVLVVALPGDHWRLAFGRRGDAWLPLASHRLALLPGDDPEVDVRTIAEPLPAEARTERAAATGGFALAVAPAATGAVLRGTVPAPLAPAIARAIALALDPGVALPGLEEPNLAAWAEHRLLANARASEQRGERSQAHAERQAAARLRSDNTALQARLAQDAERRGEREQAAEHGWQALLATRDPRQRSVLCRQLAVLARQGADPVAWRTAARERLRDADPEQAAALLHTARRLHDEPALDYRLQSQLHRLRDDECAARATALLAREHAGVAIDVPTFVAELWLTVTPPVSAAAHPPAAAGAGPADDALPLATPFR